MYPIDRRMQAQHVYSLFSSLRKAAVVLQVSHSTVARWLKDPTQKKYSRKSRTKTDLVIDTIRSTLQNDPFISLVKLRLLILNVLGIRVSKELIRTAIKCQLRYSKKKAKYFSSPSTLKQKTEDFLVKRQQFLSENIPFVSLDETSFGRNGIETHGYAPIGSKLVIKKPSPRMTTVSALALISRDAIVQYRTREGSYNTQTFIDFLNALDISPGTVILLDNVSFHHSKVVKALAEQREWILLYVPPYSPWFNPIEGVFSIVKRHYYQNLSIKNAFDSASPSHCRAFFDKSMRIQEMPLR